MINCGALNGALHKFTRKGHMSYNKTVIGQRKKPISEAIKKIKETLYRMLNSTIGLNSETFLRVSWSKEITICSDSGFVLKPEIAHRWRDKQTVYENRKLYLYAPWIIETHYYYLGAPKRVVVDNDGDEQIETHEFSYHVQRKKYPWWNSYRIVNRFDNDETEFDRALDNYLNGGF